MEKINIFKKDLLDAINKFDNIVITGHKMPDPDCYGSVLSLTEILKKLFKNKNLNTILEKNDFLESVASGEFSNDPSFLPEGDFLLISVDTASKERIYFDGVDKASFVVKIDHHPDDVPFGDLSLVDVSYASASEMVIDLFNEELDFLLNKSIAKNAFFGIVGDTGRFLYNSTNSRTLVLASKLLISNLDVKKEIHDIIATKDIKISRLEGLVKSEFEVYNDVAYFIIDESIMNKYDVNFSEASNVVNSMANIKNINVWVLAIESNGEFRVRIRSNERNINPVAKKYNGGGHPLASGAKVSDREELLSLIKEL